MKKFEVCGGHGIREDGLSCRCMGTGFERRADGSHALSGTLGETVPGIEGWRARADAGMLNANAPPVEPAPKTEPAPPPHLGEYREHAIVTGIDWTHNIVTLQLRLPISLDELPSVDDEVEVSWPGRSFGCIDPGKVGE